VYRESIDTLAADNARLRRELEALRAEADLTRRMTAPQRVLRLGAAALVALSAAAGVTGVVASRTYSDQRTACLLRNTDLLSDVARARTSEEAIAADRSSLRVAVVREQAQKEQAWVDRASCESQLPRRALKRLPAPLRPASDM
jgi:hypothetical protein